LSGTVDAWETFSRTEIALFTRHAPDKLAWPVILIRITRNISELDRLRKLLITKRERFVFKLQSVSLFHSLAHKRREKAKYRQVKSATLCLHLPNGVCYVLSPSSLLHLSNTSPNISQPDGSIVLPCACACAQHKHIPLPYLRFLSQTPHLFARSHSISRQIYSANSSSSTPSPASLRLKLPTAKPQLQCHKVKISKPLPR
jgi:hypothetical protein